jgi:hypothetical protein
LWVWETSRVYRDTLPPPKKISCAGQRPVVRKAIGRAVGTAGPTSPTAHPPSPTPPRPRARTRLRSRLKPKSRQEGKGGGGREQRTPSDYNRRSQSQETGLVAPGDGRKTNEIRPKAAASTTVSRKKAGFAKLVDASATTGANLALVRGEEKNGHRRRPTRRFRFNLAYDRLVFNGLLFIWDTLKK